MTPTDLVNDEILALQLEGAPQRLVSAMWEVMKAVALNDIKTILKR